MPAFTLKQLPERFQSGPKSKALTAYISAKYGAYGYSRSASKTITYNPEWSPEHSRNRYRWLEYASDGVRIVGKAESIIRLNHTGYYVDNFQDETVHGEVLQLPARNGEPLYVPAVNDPCNADAYVVDFNSSTGSKEDAAHWSDSMAMYYAENARADQAKEDAKLRLEEIETEIKETYADFRDVAREIRANCDALKGISVVRQLVREKWTATKEHIRKLRREQKRIEDYGIEY